MNRQYCDGCGKDVTGGLDVVDFKPKSEGLYLNGKSEFYVKIISGFNAWNTGNLCEDCLFELVKGLLGKK